MDYTWKVHYDPSDSDHFPIILEITQPIHDNKTETTNTASTTRQIGMGNI